MGIRHSSEDRSEKRPLLSDTDDDCPLLEDISLVLIGESGKNRAGNIILGQKTFNFFSKFKTPFMVERRIYNRNIKLVCTSGSIKDLCDKKKGFDFCLSLFHPSPNIILLVIDLNDKCSEVLTGIREGLPKLFTEKVWDHTMPLFLLNRGQNVEEFDDNSILFEIKQLCNNKYCSLNTSRNKDQNKEFFKAIEESIADNDNKTLCLKPNNELCGCAVWLRETHDIRSRLQNKVVNLENDIAHTTVKQKVNRDKPFTVQRKYEKILKSKNAEIQRLQVIIAKKDELIQKLQANDAQTQLSQNLEIQKLRRENAEQHKQIAELQKERSEKDKQIQDLQRQLEQKMNRKSESEILFSSHSGEIYSVSRMHLEPEKKTKSGQELFPLTSASAQTVEAPLASPPSPPSPPSPLPAPSGPIFVKIHRSSLVTRLGQLQPLLLWLQDRGVLIDEELEEVKSRSPKTLQNQALLDMVARKGEAAQDEFYQAMKKNDPFLVKDLEKQIS